MTRTAPAGAGKTCLTCIRKVSIRLPMEHPIHSGSRRAGFTLVELMIVMAVIVILISVAIPRYQKAVTRAKETVLHSNLAAIRNAIDEYSYDKQKAPQTLNDLVTDGYLREVP